MKRKFDRSTGAGEKFSQRTGSLFFSPSLPRLSLAGRNFSTSQRIIRSFRSGAVYLRFFHVCRVSYGSPSRAVNTSFRPSPSSSSQFLFANLRVGARPSREIYVTASELQEPPADFLFFSATLSRYLLIRPSVRQRRREISSTPRPS